jgi:hypothetical protein
VRVHRCQLPRLLAWLLWPHAEPICTLRRAVRRGHTIRYARHIEQGVDARSSRQALRNTTWVQPSSRSFSQAGLVATYPQGPSPNSPETTEVNELQSPCFWKNVFRQHFKPLYVVQPSKLQHYFIGASSGILPNLLYQFLRSPNEGVE